MMKTLATLLLVSSLTACQHQALHQPIIPRVSATLTAQKLLQVSQLRTPLLYLEAPIYDSEVQEWIPNKDRYAAAKMPQDVPKANRRISHLRTRDLPLRVATKSKRAFARISWQPRAKPS